MIFRKERGKRIQRKSIKELSNDEIINEISGLAIFGLDNSSISNNRIIIIHASALGSSFDNYSQILSTLVQFIEKNTISSEIRVGLAHYHVLNKK